MTAFYFDNPNFRAREGDSVPYKDIMVTVPRASISRTTSRGSSWPRQPASRDADPAGMPEPDPDAHRRVREVDHCGGVSVWRVSSGGRMGAVFGEDAIEVAPPATNCTQNCQAQNRVRGRSVKLNFPFPVPATSRLNPRFPAGFQP